MKKIHLVQFEEYSDAFCAFEEYGNAYDFAAAYAESMPGRHRSPADMIREAFLMDGGPSLRDVFSTFEADVADELDRIGAETEEYWRSRDDND